VGPFVVHWLQDHAAAATSDGIGATARGRSVRTALQLSSVLGSSPALWVTSALLALAGVLVLAWPALRPGWTAAKVTEAGRLLYVWDMLHPVFGWMLRVLLAGWVAARVVRIGLLMVPSLEGLVLRQEPCLLKLPDAQAERGVQEALATVAAALGQKGRRVSTMPPAVRQLLAMPSAGTRLLACLAEFGMVAVAVGLVVILTHAYTVTTPVLLPDEPALVPGLGLNVTLEQVQAISSHSGAGVEVTLRWQGAESDLADRVKVSDRHWRARHGVWARMTGSVPVLSLAVHDAAGAPLTLQALVGDRRPVAAYRAAVLPGEEELLAVPEAGVVLRTTMVTDGHGQGRVLLEALDGTSGALLGRLFADEQTTLTLAAAVVTARLEQACVISAWRLPGLGLVAAGLVLLVIGILVRPRARPWRVWAAVAEEPDGTWRVRLAADPASLADVLAERIEAMCPSSS